MIKQDLHIFYMEKHFQFNEMEQLNWTRSVNKIKVIHIRWLLPKCLVLLFIFGGLLYVGIFIHCPNFAKLPFDLLCQMFSSLHHNITY